MCGFDKCVYRLWLGQSIKNISKLIKTIYSVFVSYFSLFISYLIFFLFDKKPVSVCILIQYWCPGLVCSRFKAIIHLKKTILLSFCYHLPVKISFISNPNAYIFHGHGFLMPLLSNFCPTDILKCTCVNQGSKLSICTSIFRKPCVRLCLKKDIRSKACVFS